MTLKISIEIPYEFSASGNAKTYLDDALAALGYVRKEEAGTPVREASTGSGAVTDMIADTLRSLQDEPELPFDKPAEAPPAPVDEADKPAPAASPRKRRAKAEPTPNISASPENRVDPTAVEQDAADEAAEAAKASGGKLTLDDLRHAVGRFIKKFGMAASPRIAEILGCKLVDVPDTQEALAEAIAKVEAAINEDAPAAEPEPELAQEPAQEPETAKTKDDVRERLLAYQAKYGQEAVMEDGPRCLQLVFGDHVTKLSEIPPTPEDYAKACEAIDEMIVVNPYKRKPIND